MEHWTKIGQDQCSHDIETSQLICATNYFTGFCVMEALVLNGLIHLILQRLVFLPHKN